MPTVHIKARPGGICNPTAATREKAEAGESSQSSRAGKPGVHCGGQRAKETLPQPDRREDQLSKVVL